MAAGLCLLLARLSVSAGDAEDKWSFNVTPYLWVALFIDLNIASEIPVIGSAAEHKP